MKRTDTEIHIIELLLTLDYLLHYSDCDHPASREEICRHAREYGLTYNGGVKGDDVKRQRITTCLDILYRIFNKHDDRFPFLLEKTPSGKYYIEQRNGLNEFQTAEILAAIKNDKYTKTDDVSFLQERILEAFSTTDEYRDIINKEYRRLLRGVNKFDDETIRKINLIEKAYREQRLIKVRWVIYQDKTPLEFFFWYRVYLMKEFQGKPYAFLVPTNMAVPGGKLILNENYIFKPIEDIDIPNWPDSKILNYDKDENKDFREIEKHFARHNPKIIEKYKTLDNFVKKMISPMGGSSIIVTFYFTRNLLPVIKRSYERFFVEKFIFAESNDIAKMDKAVNYYCKAWKNVEIVADELKPGEKGKYGLVNVSVNAKAFQSWLLSDPYGDGMTCIANLVNIVKPHSVIESLERFFGYQFGRYSVSFTDEDIHKFFYADKLEDNNEKEHKDVI